MTQPWLAQQAVWASRELTHAQMVLWHMIQQLDQGPDGCWLGAQGLANRTGMGDVNVKKRRAELVAAGLLRSQRHPGKRTSSWFALWPESVPLPKGGKLDERRLLELRDALDSAIRLARELAASRATPGYDGTPVPPSATGVPAYPNTDKPGYDRTPFNPDRGTTVPPDRGTSVPLDRGTRVPPEIEVEMGMSSTGEIAVPGKCVSTTPISGRAARARSERSVERDRGTSTPEGPQHIGDIAALRRFG